MLNPTSYTSLGLIVYIYSYLLLYILLSYLLLYIYSYLILLFSLVISSLWYVFSLVYLMVFLWYSFLSLFLSLGSRGLSFCLSFFCLCDIRDNPVFHVEHRPIGWTNNFKKTLKKPLTSVMWRSIIHGESEEKQYALQNRWYLAAHQRRSGH